MSREHAKPIILVLLLWLGVVIFGSQSSPHAHGASGQNGYPPNPQSITAIGYNPDSQNTQPWRGPLTVADTTALTAVNMATFTVANRGRIRVLGRPNLPLSVRFTGPEGTYCAVAFAPIWHNDVDGVDHLLGISDVTTVTATQFTDPDGRRIGTTVLSDSYGCSDGIWLLVTAPTTGSVYFDPGSY